MATAHDRLGALLAPANTTLNGIDYVEVAGDHVTLRVHFLTDVALVGTVIGATVTGGETIPTVELAPVDDAADWSADSEGRPVLTLHAAASGDFSFYTLTLVSARLDRFFDRTRFSFKATCESDLDCEARPEICPPEEGSPPPIDYLAKDFYGFRRALSDFSALRYPAWQERAEADVGTMLLEALSAVADDLSYLQDRVAAEATLDTATERRSIVRHARLVDYEPRPATAAQVLLQLDVTSGPVPAGLLTSARGADGLEIEFETGRSIGDTSSHPVDPRWNRPLRPWYWDDSVRCLRAGATEMWVEGHGFGFFEGQSLLLDTPGETTADPPTRQVVRLASSSPGRDDFAVEEVDELFPDAGGNPTPVTHIRWQEDDALLADHDLTRTELAGNLVPAIQGRRHVESFAVEQAPPGARMPVAVVREGPNPTVEAVVPQYLHTLRAGRLAWREDEDPGTPPVPEILLRQQPTPPAATPWEWTWRRRLLDAEPFESAFTVDAASYRPLLDASGAVVVHEYDGDGDTVRFGDGVFGEVPDRGAVFAVTYRVCDGLAGNVAADAITRVDPSAAGWITRVTNPFPATGGADPEPDDRVRRLAPHAFRAVQHRAVRREDYEAAARTLPWVDRAGTVFRWTGSWLTVFTTADPKGTEHLPVERQTELVSLLDRYRMAGYESYVPAPRYVALDLVVVLCARPDAFRADVAERVAAALRPFGDRPGDRGFFHPDHFTFGTPLERSALEAAVQDVVGVLGIHDVRYRRRGVTAGYVTMPETVRVASDQVVRVHDDPNRPEAGSVRVVVEGGK
ncbi:MAG TPA: baseplate J/gp47 family protein [Acidimicrobiales bacterium]|nr:baseplate J/gp47 family protein [Acidimicrobiales bacterium]